MEPSNLHEFLEQNPVAEFSIYSHIQKEALKTLSASIEKKFIEISKGGPNRVINEAYGEFWLFVVGAFEVVRTLASQSRFFSEESIAKLKNLKNELIKIRAPFTKQKHAGKSTNPRGELSIYNIAKDGDFTFKIGGVQISAKNTISNFFDVTDSITRKANHG